MNLKLSQRARNLKPSVTLSINAKAKELKAKGIDVINLSAGEPDFDTPQAIKEACKKALDDGFTKYIPSQGLPSLREKIAQAVKKDLGLDYSPEEVIVTTGAKQAIFNLLFTLVDIGDEVLLLSPYWVSYPAMIELCGGVPKVVKTSIEKGFEPRIEDVEKEISSNTVGLILNSPSNPSGIVYSENFLKELSEVVKKHNLWVISDDIYDKICFNKKKYTHLLKIAPELRDSVFLVNGCSKTYAMTGWRIGWAVGPKEVIKKCASLQGQTTSHATAFAQKAAETALLLKEEEIFRMVDVFKKRKDLVTKLLREIPEVKVVEPDGTFYIFPDFSFYYEKNRGKIKNSLELAEYLLEKAKVALVPGEAFGEPKCLRISFATDEESIKKGIEKINEALRGL